MVDVRRAFGLPCHAAHSQAQSLRHAQSGLMVRLLDLEAQEPYANLSFNAPGKSLRPAQFVLQVENILA